MCKNAARSTVCNNKKFETNYSSYDECDIFISVALIIEEISEWNLLESPRKLNVSIT